MAVAENAPKLDDTVTTLSSAQSDLEKNPKPRSADSLSVDSDFQSSDKSDRSNQTAQIGQSPKGVNDFDDHDGHESFKDDMRDLEDLLSKLNPMAEEFVPPSLGKIHGNYPIGGGVFGYNGNILLNFNNSANVNGLLTRKVMVIGSV